MAAELEIDLEDVRILSFDDDQDKSNQ